MMRWNVRMKAQGCPEGVMPPRRTVSVRGTTPRDAMRAAEWLYIGWRAYAARPDRGPCLE